MLKKTKMERGIILVVLVLVSAYGYGQASFFTTSVFQNKVVFNPSQAGNSESFRADGMFRTPMNNSQPGLAKDYALTGDAPISETAGIGAVISKQNVGVLDQTLFNFCYAYGTKFKSGMKLRLGFGAGFKNSRVSDASQIIGDPNDPVLQAYNSVPPSFFSSFGATITTNNLEVQVVMPNLTAKLQNKILQTLDYPTTEAGLTYTKPMASKKFDPGSFLKVYAGVIMYKQTGMIITAGAQLYSNNLLSGTLMYSSSGIITVGVGVPIEKTVNINVCYSIGGLYSNAIYGGSGIAEVHFSYTIKKKTK